MIPARRPFLFSATLSAPDETVQLQATVRATNGTTVSGASVTWSSDAMDVATVDGDGLVTAAGPGAATVTADASLTDQGVSSSGSGTAEVTVEEPPAVEPAQDTTLSGESLVSSPNVPEGVTVTLEGDASADGGQGVRGSEHFPGRRRAPGEARSLPPPGPER